MWQKISNRPLTAFIIISILLRFLSFFYSVIDHDESTYLVIAQQLLHGKLLYVDVWDTKPVGVFVVIAGILKIFGNSIIAVRLFASVLVAFTAYSLYRLKLELGSPKNTAVFSGILYLVLVSSYRFGMAVNTELFFGFFIIAGALLYIRSNHHWQFFFPGLLWGVAFIIKYVALFDILAIASVMFLISVFVHKKPMILGNIMAVVGCVIPFLACYLYFYSSGHFSEFYHATFTVPAKYKSEVVIGDALQFILNFHLKFLPVVLLFYIALFRKDGWRALTLTNQLLPAVWFIIVWIPVIIPGKYFEHYYIQLMLPLSFLAADAIFLNDKLVTVVDKYRKWFGISVSVIVCALIYGNQSYFFTNEDTSRKVAEDIKNKLGENETIYAGKKLQVIYFLLDKEPPTKYVHPTLLTFPSHIRTLGINPDEEFNAIFEKRPRYIIYPSPHPNVYFQQWVKENYETVRNYKKDVVLMELRKGHL